MGDTQWSYCHYQQHHTVISDYQVFPPNIYNSGGVAPEDIAPVTPSSPGGCWPLHHTLHGALTLPWADRSRSLGGRGGGEAKKEIGEERKDWGGHTILYSNNITT